VEHVHHHQCFPLESCTSGNGSENIYRQEITGLISDTPFDDHLGVGITILKIVHFLQTSLKHDVFEYCKSCHVYLVVCKPTKKTPSATLLPILDFWRFEEPYNRVLDSGSEHLPKTHAGNPYLMRIICTLYILSYFTWKLLSLNVLPRFISQPVIDCSVYIKTVPESLSAIRAFLLNFEEYDSNLFSSVWKRLG